MYKSSRNAGKGITMVLVSLWVCLCPPSPTPAADTVPGSGLERVLAGTAQRLGWPATISASGDLPGQALQITGSGTAQAAMVRAAATLLPGSGELAFLDAYAQRGLTHGIFHGWEAIIVRSGDRLCDDQGRAKLGSSQSTIGQGPDSPTPCREAYGLIAWHSGPYGFIAEDATGSGQELRIAEALYAAAQEHTLSGLGSTVVILAETTDVPGGSSRQRLQALTQEANLYYSLNGYGRVSFDFTFMDADGSRGSNDWYNVGPSMAPYRNDDRAYGVAALQRAFTGASLLETVYLQRVIVVFPQEGQEKDGRRPLFTATIWLPDDLPTLPSPYGSSAGRVGKHYVEVQGAQHRTRIYVPNLVLIAEQQALGAWVHELGHTLNAKCETEGGYRRISDRYDYGQPGRDFGGVGLWDLMGSGSSRGNPESTSPTQMSSYTKEAAGWLRYRLASPGHDYLLMSLENQRMGDLVLRLDDPLVSDPRYYYVVEARDGDVPFGAPRSGVAIYQVSYDHKAKHSVVDILDILSAQAADLGAQRMGQPYQRPTLHEVTNPEGSGECIIAGGLRIRLLAESFSPYRATVHIERYSPRPAGTLARAN